MHLPRWLSPVLKYLLGLLVLAYVLWANWRPKPGTSGPGLADVLAGPFAPLPFLTAAALLAAALLGTIFRWWLLARALDLPLQLREAYRLGLLGFFLNTLLPGAIGGDLVKAAAMMRRPERRTAAVASILIDRAIGLMGLISVVAVIGGVAWLSGAAMMIGQPALRILVHWSLIALGSAAAVWIFLGVLPQWRADRLGRNLNRIPKLGGVAAEFWKAVWLYRQRPMAVYTALALSLCIQTLKVVAFHCAVRAFVIDDDQLPGFDEHLLMVPAGLVVKALFPAPGGAGGGEFGFGTLYELTGRNPAFGVVGSLALLLIDWCLGAVAYFSATMMRAETKGKIEELETS